MRIVFIGLFSLSLAGCGTTGLFSSIQNPVNLNSLSSIESTYGVALSVAVGYRRLPLCTLANPLSVSNVCAKRSVVLQLQSADQKAQIALSAARSFAANNPSLSAASIISTAQTAVSTFLAIESANGVH